MRELLVLRGLLKREEQKAELLKPAPRTLTPVADPALGPTKVAPNYDPQRCASTRSPKRRRKPAPLGSLYPQPEPEPLVHAKALLRQIQLHAEDVVGTYIPQSHLQRFYHELCELEGWEPRNWTAIGRRLNGLTDRRRIKRNGRQFRAYRIPRPRRD